MPSVPPPPPPPPPPPQSAQTSPEISALNPTYPGVPTQGPPGAYLVELLIFDGRPFLDHWVYWVRSHIDPAKGIYIHATGDVRNGFELEFKRCYDVNLNAERPHKIVPLQWVPADIFTEDAIYHDGVEEVDTSPACEFERSVFQVKAPGKSLNSMATSRQKITQRNCQTWIVESADRLVEDGIFTSEVAGYLRASKQ